MNIFRKGAVYVTGKTLRCNESSCQATIDIVHLPVLRRDRNSAQVAGPSITLDSGVEKDLIPDVAEVRQSRRRKETTTMRTASARQLLFTLPLYRLQRVRHATGESSSRPQPSRPSCTVGPLTVKEMNHEMALFPDNEGAEWFSTASASVLHGDVVGSRATAYWAGPPSSGQPP